MLLHMLKGRKLMNPSPSLGSVRSRRNTSGELGFSFPWCTAAVLERGAWGWRQSPSFKSWLCHSERQGLHSENEDGNTTRLQCCFLFYFYYLFHFFSKIRSWPTKLISWPITGLENPDIAHTWSFSFSLGIPAFEHEMCLCSMSAQPGSPPLCVSPCFYSFEIKEKNTSFTDTESGMLWAGRLRSCLALSEFPNLSLSPFPLF